MSLPNQSEIAEVKSSSSMNFEMILDIAFPKDGNKDELTIVSLDVFSVEDITDILALLSSPANTNKNDKSSCLLSINEVSNQCTSGFKAQVCDALHNHWSHLHVTAQQQSALFLFQSALESQLSLTQHEVSKGAKAVSQYKDTIEFVKSIFSSLFLGKVQSAVNKLRSKEPLSADDKHHFELYKKISINY
jgi:hypothetical protein